LPKYNQLTINCAEISALQKCNRTGSLHLVIVGVFLAESRPVCQGLRETMMFGFDTITVRERASDRRSTNTKKPSNSMNLKASYFFVIPFGQFSNKFYESLKVFYELKALIDNDLKINPDV
jgi:hypothetical protein